MVVGGMDGIGWIGWCIGVDRLNAKIMHATCYTRKSRLRLGLWSRSSIVPRNSHTKLSEYVYKLNKKQMNVKMPRMNKTVLSKGLA